MTKKIFLILIVTAVIGVSALAGDYKVDQRAIQRNDAKRYLGNGNLILVVTDDVYSIYSIDSIRNGIAHVTVWGSSRITTAGLMETAPYAFGGMIDIWYEDEETIETKTAKGEEITFKRASFSAVKSWVVYK
jgi:hypothetical protein